MKLAKNLHLYYLFVISFLIIGTISGTYYFWNNGPINPENLSTIYESSIEIEELENKEVFKQVKSLVNNDRARDSLKMLEKLDSKVKKINDVASVETYSQYVDASKALRSSIMKLISLPEIQSIFLVLNTKINNFKTYVVQNKWRTLTRVSSRLANRIKPSNFQTRNSLSEQKVISLNRNIQKDIKLMRVVTEGSILSSSDKSGIIGKLETLSTELGMIEKYSEALEGFNKDYNVFQNEYTSWQSAVLPEIEMNKIKFESTSKYFIYLSILVVTFLVVSIVVGFRLHKNTEAKVQEFIEQNTLNLIKEEIIPFQSKGINGYSKDFENDFYRTKDYFHKRMSFGSIFQEATPFTTLMLDSNLNLIWANELFYDSWNIENNLKENNSISWDFLQQYTNLGEIDPVQSALKENISGIYNIQIKTNNDEDALPYEMYVSPVEYSNQKRIMIFLYPLRSIEESMSYQTRSIVGPVTRTIEAMSSDTYTNEFKEKILKDFEIAGIEHIHEKFGKLNNKTVTQKDGLLNEIDRLEDDLLDSQKVINDLKIINQELASINSEINIDFTNTKESIIESIELRSEIQDLYQNTSNNSRVLFKEQNELLEKSVKTNDLLKESVDSFTTILKTRNELKTSRKNIEEFKYNIMQSLDQLLIFQRNGQADNKLSNGLNKFKLEVKSFDSLLNTLGGFLTSLDVSLSKAEIIMGEQDIPDFTKVHTVLARIRDLIESDMFNIERVARNGEKTDEKLVGNLRSFYEKFNQTKSVIESTDEYIEEFRNSHVDYFDETIVFDNDMESFSEGEA